MPTPNTNENAGNLIFESSQHNSTNTEQYAKRLLLEQGVVESVDKGFAYVVTQRATGCSGCQSSSGCGTSALSKLFSSTSGVNSAIKVSNTEHCQPGDVVMLSLDESRLLKHSFMAYGLPLLGLFILAWLSSQILQTLGASPVLMDVGSIVGGLFGLIVGWTLTRKFYQPIMPCIQSVLSRVNDKNLT
ncbi:SoxR reducing system RseC family protein [Thiomicrorhabdus aquaedulcis]|uniref:SoxR reducing system RseC family protein n=1 Tax=Thiomicrorhabdus aquaedulcis TaxID=2211106 RepID=UPI000FD7FF81|nr:SoxR reducing system RseC family protein [Thiomicrorhabdus aquaedulcis]